jgi:hypothetical protein
MITLTVSSLKAGMLVKGDVISYYKRLKFWHRVGYWLRRPWSIPPRHILQEMAITEVLSGTAVELDAS